MEDLVLDREGAWPEGFEYFKRAWGFVLNNFAESVSWPPPKWEAARNS